MSGDLSEIAITDAISNVSISKNPFDGQSKLAAPGLRLNRDIVSRAAASKDITEEFRQAAKHLDTGELIKDDFFTLFDSVGALEIMDSKMDSGYLEPGESLDDDYDISRDILPEELIAIMDSLLCLQVAWQTGYPLSQTVYASVYIENILWPNPKILEEATLRDRTGGRITLTLCQSILRVYCLLLLKSCDLIYRRISDETYYEEEDFFTQLYNRSLLTAFPADHIVQIAEVVSKALGATDSIPLNLREAINSRLNLQFSFMQATKDAMESMPEAVKASWRNVVQHLGPVRDTHNLGKPVPSSTSSKIQRKLASSVPPRPIVELGFEPALDFLTRLCDDGILVEDISECSDLGSAVMFVSYFQSQHPHPTVYMRCQLQRLVLRKFEYLGDPNASILSQPDLFGELIRLVHPDDRLTNSNNTHESSPEISAAMQKFASLVNETFWGYIRALTMNRSRTRRMLCHTAIEWDAVQLELEDLDTDLRKITNERPLISNQEELWEFPLSSWAYDIKLRQLILIHQLGFELEIYHKEELSAAYWSLQWICSVRHAHLERIMAFIRAKSSKLNRSVRAEVDQMNTTILTVNWHLDYSIAVAALSEGLSALYRALMLLDLIPSPPSAAYSTDSLRHALRTRPFRHIIHPPLPSAEETESTRADFISDLITTARAAKHKPPRQSYDPQVEEALALLDHVDSMTKSARKAWENVSKTKVEIARASACESSWRNEMKNSQKSAIAMSLVAVTTRKWIDGGMKSGALDVKVDMGHESGLYHVFWVIPKVKLATSAIGSKK